MSKTLKIIVWLVIVVVIIALGISLIRNEDGVSLNSVEVSLIKSKNLIIYGTSSWG